MGMESPRLRSATLDDLEALVELRILMQSDAHSGKQPPPGYAEVVRKYFARTLSDGSSLTAVAEVEGRIVSTVTAIVYEKPPAFNGLNGRSGYISNVYTLPEHRGRGIATEVMRFIVEHTRREKVDKLHLTSTELGKGVYERVGFAPPKFVAMELRFPSA